MTSVDRTFGARLRTMPGDVGALLRYAGSEHTDLARSVREFLSRAKWMAKSEAT